MTPATFASGRRRGSTAAAFGGMASLFSAQQKGAYFDFTNFSTLAVNADGSGGSPVGGGTARWCKDLSPNANHLRNTVSTVSVAANGISTSGTNYGLFNMPGFGNWPTIPEPLTIIACLEILSFHATDERLIGSNGSGQILQGTSAGKVRLFSNYSPEVQIGLNQEATLVGVWNGSSSSVAVGSGMPQTWASANGAMDALCLGSGTGPGPCASVRFKRLFVRQGVLSALEREGVLTWAAA